MVSSAVVTVVFGHSSGTWEKEINGMQIPEMRIP
jgi:hypothetical protein